MGAEVCRLARGSGLGAPGQREARQNVLCRNPLHSHLSSVVARGGADPYHAKLGTLISQANIQKFAQSKAPVNALQHKPACAHVGNHGRASKGLTVRIHAPDLNWQLHFHSGAAASVHSVPQQRVCRSARNLQTYAGYLRLGTGVWT